MIWVSEVGITNLQNGCNLRSFHRLRLHLIQRLHALLLLVTQDKLELQIRPHTVDHDATRLFL